MSGTFGSRRLRRKPSINVTSLVDVMFLLIIFFSVSTTFRQQFGVDVALPEAVTAARQDMRTHEIIVTSSGEYYFGQQRVDEGGLRTSLKEVIVADPDTSVILRADEKADFGSVLRAIDIAREVGGTKLVIPTRQRIETPSSY